MGLFVATVETFAVRDVQYCTSAETAADSSDWVDAGAVEIFAGVYHEEDAEAARAAAAKDMQTVAENIRLIEIE